MQFLTLDQGQDWLRKYGYNDIRLLESGDLSFFKYKVSYLLPKDSGVKTNLSGYLADFIDSEGEVFLWITRDDVWPSCDNKDLFYAYRNYIGESRSLEEVPCHVFLASDKIALKNLISLILYFFYDAVLVKKFNDSTIVIYFSHDEIIEIYSDNNEKFVELMESFDLYKFKTITK